MTNLGFVQKMWPDLARTQNLPNDLLPDDLAGDLTAGRLRAKQLRALAGAAEITAVLNALNAAMITYVFWSTATARPLMLWLAANVIYSCLIYVEKITAMRAGDTASTASLRWTVMRATALGALWGWLPWIVLPVEDPLYLMTLGVVIAGMMSGGVVRLAIVPMAALSFMWMLVILACSAILKGHGMVPVYSAVLVVSYALFLSRHVVSHSRILLDNWRTQFELKDSNETIRLLLNELQDDSSDWLWHSDPQGRLRNVSDRFAEAAGRPTAELQGLALRILFDGAGIEESNAAFLRCVDHRESFREVQVTAMIGGRERHWLMTGHPQFDSQGGFRGFRGVGSDVTHKIEAEARIAYLAQFDPVTGLMNRDRFRAETRTALARLRPDEMLAVLCLDIEQFKSLNDTMGYQVGDALLCEIGKRLSRCVGGLSLVSHLGGDKFAMLQICGEDESAAMLLAEASLDTLKRPVALEGSELTVSGNIGIATARAGGDPDDLMRDASLALRRARLNGRGGYCFFESGMDEIARRRTALEQSLRNAIDQDELHVLFQPLVGLDSGRVECFEALIRWNSRDHGFVSPVEFIPIAEECGLIVDIDEWVLRTATKEAAKWPNDVRIAVNLSPAHFRSRRLLATVVQALDESGLVPSRLDLEITESTFLDADDATMELLGNLQTLGVRISLDDFGTGYSSLSYLRKFPFDKIKIDRSFITNVVADHSSASIVKAIVDLAKALGMTTTAEGVEEPAQLAVLRALGCSSIQGYIFARPSPAADVPELITRTLDDPADSVTPRMHAQAG